MQFAISGTYYQGQIQLNELPPIDEPSEVMVVFLPKLFSPEKTRKSKASNRQKQMGILSDFKADPAFYEPLDKDELDKW